MLALNETVRVAQQLNDDTILQHALSQLCCLLASSIPCAAAEGGQPVDTPAYFAQLFQLLQRSHPAFRACFWMMINLMGEIHPTCLYSEGGIEGSGGWGSCKEAGPLSL